MNKDKATEAYVILKMAQLNLRVALNGTRLFEMDNPWCLSANGTLFRTDT